MHLEHIYAQQARNKFPADPAVIRAGAGLHMVAAAVVVLGDDGGRPPERSQMRRPEGRWAVADRRRANKGCRVRSRRWIASPAISSSGRGNGFLLDLRALPGNDGRFTGGARRSGRSSGAALRRHPDGSGQDPPLLTSAQLPGILTVADRAESPQREPMHETRGGSHDAGAPSRGWRDGAPLPRPRAAHPEDVLAGTAPSDGALSAVGTVPTDPRLDIDTRAWGLRSVALLARPRGLGFSAEVPPP